MVPSIDCPSEERVARFLDGDLKGELRGRFEHHVATCSACLRLLGNVARASAGSLDSTALAVTLPVPSLPPETRVGRYVVQSEIGAGAMGRVYVAYDPTLDRQVALKLLHVASDDARLEARLLREAKVMARLANHPEVVPVYDAGTHGAQLFIAMELVDGGTLRAWLAARRRTWREVVTVFQHAGRGLAHAHAAGLVHRDFKPDNVLVGRDGRARVTDFGLARAARTAPDDAIVSGHSAGAANAAVDATLTRTGTLVGTPAYMAPEQLAGTEADARSDIFSFCVAFYEALYGQRPFTGSTLGELKLSVTTGRFSPPARHRDVPRALRRILEVGLRPDPSERHASMAALLEAMERGTREPALQRFGVAGPLLAATLAVPALPLFFFLRGERHADSAVAALSSAATALALPAPREEPVPVVAATVASAEPSAVTVAVEVPPKAAPVAHHPAVRAKTPSPPRASAQDAGATPTTQDEDARVVEGRNGAPIMR